MQEALLNDRGQKRPGRAGGVRSTSLGTWTLLEVGGLSAMCVG